MIYKNNNKYPLILLNIIELNTITNSNDNVLFTNHKLTSFNIKQKLLTLLRLFIDELSKLCLRT